MKTAKIYYEGQFIYSVEITQMKTIANAYQLSHNELVCAIVPLNHLIVIGTEKQSVPNGNPVTYWAGTTGGTISNNDTVTYWGGITNGGTASTNLCNNTFTVSKRQIDDILSNTIDRPDFPKDRT